MATTYTKKQWATGNLIGAVDLNRMETGIEEASTSGGGSLVIRATGETTTEGDYTYHWYDKTWQEVYDALAEGKFVVVLAEGFDEGNLYVEQRWIDSAGYDGANYQIYGSGFLTTNSANGYLYERFGGATQ